MIKYSKKTPRLTVKFINSDTEEELFEIKDRNWTNVGDIFPDHIVSSILDKELQGKEKPKNIMLLAIGEYST